MASRQPIVEYLTTTRIGEKGQLTVPNQFRRDLDLVAGSPCAVLRLGNGLILVPERKRFADVCDQIAEALIGAGITSEDFLATLPEARTRVFRRRYKKASALPHSARRNRRSSRKK